MRGTSRLFLWVTAIGAFSAGAYFGPGLLLADAFADFKPDSGPLGKEIGIQLNDVDMTVYDGDKIVTEASIDSVNVHKDRQLFDFLGVAGRSGSGEDKIDFSSDRGSYDSRAAKLRFEAGIRLQNKDFDLFAPRLTVDEHFDNIQAPGPITGKLSGGKLVAANFKYKMGSGEAFTGPFKWQGKLPGTVQEGAPVAPQKLPWDIEGSSGRRKGTISYYEDAKATDGEQMIRAKHVEYDSKTDVLVASGPAYYYSDDVNLVADKITVYRKERKVLLVDNVRMLVKPKDQPDIAGEIPPFRPDVPDNIAQNRPDPPSTEELSQQKDLDEALRSSKTIRDYPALVKAAAITYWYRKGERRADITGNPECLQDFPGGRWRRVSAGKAFYDGEKETLKLDSIEGKTLARLKTSIGDNLTATWFEISTMEGDDDVQDWNAKNPKGIVMVDDEEVPKKETTTGTGTTGSQGTTSGGGTTGTTAGGQGTAGG